MMIEVVGAIVTITKIRSIMMMITTMIMIIIDGPDCHEKAVEGGRGRKTFPPVAPLFA